MKKSTLIRRAVSILIALAMSFACIPAFTGSLDVNAAAPYWKNYKVKSEAYTSNTITWKNSRKNSERKFQALPYFKALTGTISNASNASGKQGLLIKPAM